jgi:hypothetical protein
MEAREVDMEEASGEIVDYVKYFGRREEGGRRPRGS